MKWDCGPTWVDEVAAKEKWHLWFAWHPVRVGPRERRWLETVARKGKHHCHPHAGCWWAWKYK
jgi:hypothetical protein